LWWFLSKFSAYLEESKHGPVVVTKNGKPVAVILAIVDEEDLERLILAHSPKFQAIMASGKEEIRQGEGIEHDEFWADVEAEAEGQV
jgi:prevent-host-death family protein